MTRLDALKAGVVGLALLPAAAGAVAGKLIGKSWGWAFVGGVAGMFIGGKLMGAPKPAAPAAPQDAIVGGSAGTYQDTEKL